MTSTARIVLFVTLVMFVLAAADVARAHTDEHVDAINMWVADTWADRYIDPDEMMLWVELETRYAHTHTRPVARSAPQPQPAVTPPPAPTPPIVVSGVEQWRGMVAAYFPEWAVGDALSVMSCESRGNPNAKNPTSSAAGLFQFIRSTWDWVAPNVGAGSYDSGAVYDPASNVAAAHWLWSSTGGWSHWVCQP